MKKTPLLLSALAGFVSLVGFAPAASAADCPASIAPVAGGYADEQAGGRDVGAPGGEKLWEPGQLIVSLKRSATTAELRCVARELKARIIDGGTSSDGLAGVRNTMVLELRPGVSVAATMRLLEQRRYENLIRYAAPNYEVSVEADPTREPLYKWQWGLNNQKRVPKASPNQADLDKYNDRTTPMEWRDLFEENFMNVMNVENEVWTTNETIFSPGLMPFSIQVKRAWNKNTFEPPIGFNWRGPSVAVIDTGLAQHFELENGTVTDKSRLFSFKPSNNDSKWGYRVRPGAKDVYQLEFDTKARGKFMSCPIPVGADAAGVQKWLNRDPQLCKYEDVVSVAYKIDADGGTYSIIGRSGRTCPKIPIDAKPDQIKDCITQQFGIEARVRSLKGSVAGLKGNSITVSKEVFDREQFTFEDSSLTLNGGPGYITDTEIVFDDFVVQPSATSEFTFTIEEPAGGIRSLDRRDISYDRIDKPKRIGGAVEIIAPPNGSRWTGDVLGHGTFVAGIIAANPSNRRGMTGVVNNAWLRLTAATWSGGNATSTEIAEAISYVADDPEVKADVVNMSMGWGSQQVFPNDPPVPSPKSLRDPDPLAPDAATDAIRNVKNGRTLFVAAAGNGHYNVFNPGPVIAPKLERNKYLVDRGRASEINPMPSKSYPCRPKNGGRKSVLKMPDGTYDRGNILCVASSNPYGEPSDFSNWGAGVVDVMAPGENILSLNNDGKTFVSQQGTSYAAPMVSGVAALIRQFYPAINEASIVKCAILSSATTRPPVIAGNAFDESWKEPFKIYAGKKLLGEAPGQLPLSKRVFTVNGMVQADEAISAAGSLWSRYKAALKKENAARTDAQKQQWKNRRPACVQRRAGSFWGKGKWINADELPPGF